MKANNGRLTGFSIALASASLAVATGCNAPAAAGGGTADPAGAGPGGVTAYQEPQGNQEQRALPANKRVLVYAGTGAAYDDPESIAAIAIGAGLEPVSVSSGELNAMSLDELAGYGAILWPGGYGGQQSGSLTEATRDNIRRAVIERGVSYVGFCAGAFVGASPVAKPGRLAPAYGFALIPTDDLLPYYHLEDEGTESAMVRLKMADGSNPDIVWWGGPALPEVPGGVLGRHGDDNTPAIIQAQSGKGMVILSGPHPEAPEVWRSRLGLSDSDGAEGDWAIAAKLFDAAVSHKKLQAF